MQTPSNQLYQRYDFQNRRSASEPVHDLQHQHSRCTDTGSSHLVATHTTTCGGGASASVTPHQSTSSGNSSSHSAHATGVSTNQMQVVGSDNGFVDCLQKIPTVKVRFNISTKIKHIIT